jgi:hypothetical protein
MNRPRRAYDRLEEVAMNACRMFPGNAILCAVVSLAALNLAAQSSSATAAARANELQSRYMTAVKTELTSKLDTKTAVAGQPLTLKTEAAVTLADGTVIPEGTKLVGRVIGVRAKTDEQAGSMVVVTFDKAELKDGKTIAVRSMIRAVSGLKPAAPTSGDVMTGPVMRNNDPVMGGVATADTENGSSGSRRNGGGAVNGAGGTATGSMGGTPRGAAPTLGSVAGANTGDTVQMTAPGGETVSNAPRPTGLPGVLLSTNPSTDVSGTLMGSGQNIRLDNGTQITLGVILR